MPIREIPCPIAQVPTEVPVYIIVVNKEGVERQEQGDLERKVPDGCLLSDLVKDHMRQNPPTDVFLVSHGFNSDQKKAEKDFQDWAKHMTKPEALPGLFAMHTKRGRAFKPLVVCVHWPSKYMAKLRALLCDWHLPSAGVELVKKAPGMAGRVVMAAGHGVDDAFRYAKAQKGNFFRKAATAAVEFVKATARGSMDGFFGRYETRAQVVGRCAVQKLLTDLQTVATQVEAAHRPSSRHPTRFHALAHSLGCHVVCSAVVGHDGEPCLPRPLHSLVLVQAAVPSTCFGPKGMYASVPKAVVGVTLVTHMPRDWALAAYSTFYKPALGRYGSSGADNNDYIRVVKTLRTDGDTRPWHAGTLVDLDTSEVMEPIPKDSLDVSKSHNNWTDARVLHALWAVLALPVNAGGAVPAAPAAGWHPSTAPSATSMAPSEFGAAAPTAAATSGPWSGLATSFAAPVAQWGGPPTGQASSAPWGASPLAAAVPPQWGPPPTGPAASAPWGAPPAAAAATPPMGAYPQAPVGYHPPSCVCALCRPMAGH